MPNKSSLPANESDSPSRMSRILLELRWVMMLAIAAYLTASLFSFSMKDPGWSHAGYATGISNWGGKIGAFAADLIFFLFGVSGWWIIVWFVVTAVQGYIRFVRLLRMKEPQGRISPLWEHLLSQTGFAVMLVSSSAVEYLRMYFLDPTLPAGAGGVIGNLIGSLSQVHFGFTCATVLYLFLWAAGFSLFVKTSWLTIAEVTGRITESLFLVFRRNYQSRQDRKIGQAASTQRAQIIEKEKEEKQSTPPVRIEPTVTKVEPSMRVVKEKQKPLFAELEDNALPPFSLLDPAPETVETITRETLEFRSSQIEQSLQSYGVNVKVVAAHSGPVITRYEIDPAAGTKGSTIVNLEKDLARSLALVSVRVIETTGKGHMALELPNPNRQIVPLSDVLGSEVYHKSASKLTIALGKDIAGNPVVADLARMPHLLVAGTTGSGKSVGINATILSLLYKATADEVRLILIDPKMLELSVYEGIPHLLCPVVTDMREAGHALSWAVNEMERRYRLMSKLGVRNLAGMNDKIDAAKADGEIITNPFTLTPDRPEPLEKLPQIVIIIDEFADLMMVTGKKIEELIARIAQKARASGIHLILATQRPSVDVITGLIKANIPTRIAFQVSSKTDSRTILDQNGAENLLGLGDMLYLPPGTSLPQRVHGAFVSDDEVHRVVAFLKEKGEPDYVEGLLDPPASDTGDAATGEGGGEEDELYDQAVAIVLKNKRASISLVQRMLRIGYNRSARLLEQMERSGIVSPMKPNGNRDILVPTDNQE